MSEPEPEPTVVGWVTLPEAEAKWADAAELDEADLTDYLQAAHEQCLAFLNDREPTEVLARHKLAQVFQARALSRSAVAGGDNQIGTEFAVTVFPMDWTVKNLLRPKRGRRGPR